MELAETRTTVRLPEDLLLEAKRYALATGRTLTAVIREALHEKLRRAIPSATPPPCQLPVYGSGGTLPGIDLDHSAGLWDLLDDFDAAPRR